MKMLLLAVPALALAACADNGAGNEAQNDVTVDAGINSSGDEVATDNLTLESSPSNADQAINATDEQSDLPQVGENEAQ